MNKFNPKNNIFQNWNKKIYIATKKEIAIDDYGNQIVKYNTPFYLGKENYQPMNWKDLQSYISAFGETTNKVVSLILDFNKKDKFKEFDLAYLYGANPENEKVNGENANYIVKSIKEQNTKVMVVLEEIIKDNSIMEEENNIEEES